MSRRIRTTFATTILVIGLSIAGCAAPSSSLDEQTSRAWQARVVAVAEYAGATDHATALQELATLESEAVQARADGEISAERASIIQQSISVVRADLEAAVAASTPPVPEDTAVTDSGESEPDDDTTSDDDTDNGNSDNSNNGNKDKNEDKKSENNGNGNGDD